MLAAKKRSRLFDELILKSWWVIVVFLICTLAYDQGMRKRKSEEVKLKKKLAEIEAEKEIASEIQEDLRFQIASQNDTAWIELVLMKRLGLVPEGQKKVYFTRK